MAYLAAVSEAATAVAGPALRAATGRDRVSTDEVEAVARAAITVVSAGRAVFAAALCASGAAEPGIVDHAETGLARAVRAAALRAGVGIALTPPVDALALQNAIPTECAARAAG